MRAQAEGLSFLSPSIENMTKSQELTSLLVKRGKTFFGFHMHFKLAGAPWSIQSHLHFSVYRPFVDFFSIGIYIAFSTHSHAS